jgi:alpha-amylase/alpha-mannosidase (GH57 family)
MLKVAFLWHMHQPYYRDPATGMMLLPWVRLHCLKDYYDLPIRVGRFDRLKMTFNLVPSLIEQIDLYVERKTSDRQLELTKKPASELDRSEKAEIFKTFFMANPKTMIEPYPIYRRLYKKLADCGMDAELAARTATTREIRDLIVWANLVWIDPIFRNREPFKRLFDRGGKFSEEDKAEMIKAQYDIMAETIPAYRSLMNEGKIEVSFTPYFHPILPLLCDTESAREALPGIILPKNRFCYPEDAEAQVSLATEMYRGKFGRELEGMWPSEGSISEKMVPILAKYGIKWMASDEQVLFASMVKSGQSLDQVSPYTMYQIVTQEGPMNVFFRDHTLSDKIGFVYSGWDEEKAVDNFMADLHRLGDTLAGRNSNAVVPIILDGENCWEYYHNDGDRFLNLFFERLAADMKIETVTMSEAARTVKPMPLKSILAGSWINHNFRIWIGHPEDNTAWDLLWEARRTLTKFKGEHPDYNPAKISEAEKSILIAEGSDWNWWYGDEHRGPQNEIFDRIYRAHLSAVYTALDLDIPESLLSPISAKLPETYVTEPEGMVTPIIDGRLTHYYEWLGAGKYDCLKAGGAMHRTDRIIARISYVADNDYVYMRVDFVKKRFLVDNKSKRLEVKILYPGQGVFIFSGEGVESIPEWAGKKEEVLYGAGDIAEIGLKKNLFFPDGKGEIYFCIGITDGRKSLEEWPEVDPIQFRFFGLGEEIIWNL